MVDAELIIFFLGILFGLIFGFVIGVIVKSNSQQPEELACQGEGGCTEHDSGFEEIGISFKKPSADYREGAN